MTENVTPASGLLSTTIKIPPPPPAVAPKPVTPPTPKVVPAIQEMNAAGQRIANKKAQMAAKKAAGGDPKLESKAVKVAKVLATPKVAKAKPAKKAIKPAKKADPKVAPKKAATKAAPKKAGAGLGSPTCSICGKLLTRPDSMKSGMGDVCAGHIKQLPAGTTLEQHYAKITMKEVPEGWIPLAEAIVAASKKGVSGYRFLQVCGGDRLITAPLSKEFKVVFVRGKRYISKLALLPVNLEKAKKV
jgi:hypothetical protein